MVQKISPFLEGKYGWDFGEAGWNNGMDENLLKFSFLFDRNVDSITAYLPPAVNGQAHYLTTDNRLYFAVGSVYFSTPVPKWFTIILRGSGETYQFDGASLILVQSTTQLADKLDAVELTVSMLGSAAQRDVGTLPENLPTNKDIKRVEDYVFSAVGTGRVIVTVGSTGSWDESIREIGNVVMNPDDEATPYRLVYTGYQGAYVGNNSYIGAATSEDGITWTKLPQLGISRSSEDPYLVLHNGLYYLYVEDKEAVPFRNIRLYTSPDFTTWTDVGIVLDIGTGWEAEDVSSPVVWVEAGTFYMLYEGRASGQGGAVGLATSTDGVNWTKSPSNPVITGVNPSFGFNGAFKWATHLVPDDIRKIGNTYVLTSHPYLANQVATPGFFVGLSLSEDLINWTDPLGHPAGTGDDDTAMYFERPEGVYLLGTSPAGIRLQPQENKKLLHATLLGSDAMPFTANTWNNVKFNEPAFSTPGWDSVEDLFTAQSSGLFRFAITHNFVPTTATRLGLQLYVNESSQLTMFSGDTTSGTLPVQLTASRELYLKKGDTVRFRSFAGAALGNNSPERSATITQVF